jgi:hypothetical protein
MRKASGTRMLEEAKSDHLSAGSEMSDQEPKTYPLQDAVPIAEMFVEHPQTPLSPDCRRGIHPPAETVRERHRDCCSCRSPSASGSESDMFERQTDCAAVRPRARELLELGVITKRLSKVGRSILGTGEQAGRFTRQERDAGRFFLVTEANWFNALVVRTGPSQSNKAIAAAAIAKRGWQVARVRQRVHAQ